MSRLFPANLYAAIHIQCRIEAGPTADKLCSAMQFAPIQYDAVHAAARLKELHGKYCSTVVQSNNQLRCLAIPRNPITFMACCMYTVQCTV